MKHILLLFAYLSLLVPSGIYAQQKTIESGMDGYLTSSVTNGYSGSILVAKEGKILLSKGYGWANKEQEIRNTSSTVFNIGSVTKQFTAAAVLKLAEKEQLALTDKISKYFPALPDDKKEITLHQLLTHTSGISPATGGFRYDEASKEKFLEVFSKSALMYAPGTKHTYANANYILLAAIIEEVAHQDYESFLRETFWEPLQMHHTGYKKVVPSSDQLAHGYYFNYVTGTWNDWGTTPQHLPQNNNHWFSIGKGDLYSTVEDLYTWHLALEGHKVLSSESQQLMETAYVPENDEKTSYYGYGWALFNTSDGRKIVTHNGSNGIYFADFIRYTDDNLVIIALSNRILNHQSENVGWEIARMVNDPSYQPKPIPKNTYELVFDFINTNTPERAKQLPHVIEEATGSALNDKAVLNRIGFNQVAEKLDAAWGIALLQLNANLFPEDGNLWDTLGEGYCLLKDKEKAIASFEKALKLQPDTDCHWCNNSSKRLEELSSH